MTKATRPELTALEAYDAWHSRLDVDIGADSPWHQLISRRLRPERDLAGRQVLEIACGRGGFACWLARHPLHPHEVTAADFSPLAVAKARKSAADRDVGGIAWQVADIQDLALFEGRFDTVFSCETIEHVPDPPRAVRELARRSNLVGGCS